MFATGRGWVFSLACVLAVASAVQPVRAAVPHAAAGHAGYEYFGIGDVKAGTPAQTSPGLLLMGGGQEIDAAFEWFAARAGHGHIVILRASGDDELQNWIYRDVGGVESVQTLVFHARAPASDPRVLEIVRHADGIFIAGGDQANYVRFWKGTPLNVLLNAHVRAGKPLGGTSAGLAILGQWGYGALDGGSITSPEALRDPDGPALTLVDHFITLPLLAHTITDTHFAQRERLGRLLAFVARLARDHHTAAITGLGVDQDSALLVDADGSARLLSWHPEGHAWVVVPRQLREVERAGGRKALAAYLRERVAPGKPLDLPGFVVVGVGTGSKLDLPGFTVTDPAFRKRIDVVDGRLLERPAPREAGQRVARPGSIEAGAARR
ncbi:MAG TPA: cyanophycinase [Rhodanobacteraceae bacterium]|nr:cyanophycinase [Rhodanobacteraceae bacterium]